MATPARRQVVRALARAGDVAELRRLADAGDPQGCRQLAVELVRAGEIDEVRARARHDRFARRALADWLVGRRRVDEAIDELRVLADTGDLGARTRLARLLAGRGWVEAAIAVVATVPPERRGRLPVARWLGSQGRADALLARLVRGDPEAGRELARIALRLWGTLRLREAVRLITRIPDPHTHLRVGALTEVARQRWREGRLHWRLAALEVLGSTEDPFCRLVRAELLLLVGQWDAAVVELRVLAGRGDETARARLAGLLRRRRPARELRAIDLGRGAYLNTVAFHPSGILASCATNDQYIALWDTDRGEPVGTLRAESLVAGAAFSVDGTLFAAGAGPRVRLWRSATGERLRDLTGPDGEAPAQFARGIAFGRDGTLLANGIAWNPATGERLHVLDPVGCRAAAFSPDGRVAATAGAATWSDPAAWLRLWDIHTGTCLRALPVAAEAVAFSPDGTLLATAAIAGSRLWDAATGEPRWELAGAAGAVAFHPGGRLVATAGRRGWPDAGVRLWDPGTGLLVDELESEADAVAFSPDGTLLATASRAEGIIQLWPVDG